MIGPKLNIWLGAYYKRQIRKSKKAEKRIRYFTEGRPDGIKLRASAKFKKWVRGEILQIIGWFGALVAICLLWWWLSIWFEKQNWELRNERVQMIDRVKKTMYLKTIREPKNPTCIEGKGKNIDELNSCIQQNEQEISINRQEYICNLRAMLESRKNGVHEIDSMQIAMTSYQVCMLEGGWFTEQCARKEQNCVEIMYKESICTLMTREWLKNGGSDRTIELCEKRLYTRFYR